MFHTPASARSANPQHHDRAEEAPDPTAPVALDQEQPDQHDSGERHHVGLQQRRHDLHALDRAEHRDRGRDHRVAEEERRSSESHDQQHVAKGPAAGKASERSAIVPPSPWLSARMTISTYLSATTRITAQNTSERTPKTTSSFPWLSGRLDRFPEGVDRARAEVAEHDAQRPDHQGAARRMCGQSFGRCSGGRRVAMDGGRAGLRSSIKPCALPVGRCGTQPRSSRARKEMSGLAQPTGPSALAWKRGNGQTTGVERCAAARTT